MSETLSNGTPVASTTPVTDDAAVGDVIASQAAVSGAAIGSAPTNGTPVTTNPRPKEHEEGETYGAAEYIVRVRGVTRVYDMGGHAVHALRGIDLDISRGEYLSIMGPSGSGKSTLFNMIGGLDKPTEGTVFIDEVDIAQLDAGELAWLRCRKLGYIFQTFNLIPVMSALENVTLPMIFAGASLEEQMEKGRRLLETVGLGHRLHNKPGELSGGQQQRVAIARALANDPAIVLADEPTGNLDQKVGAEIIQMLKRLNRESGVTIITATHDDKMLKTSDRVAVVLDGAIDSILRPSELGEDTTSGFGGLKAAH